MSEQEKAPEPNQPTAIPDGQTGQQPTGAWAPDGGATPTAATTAWSPQGTASAADSLSGAPQQAGPPASPAADGAPTVPGAQGAYQPWATGPQAAPPGYWPPNWPTPLGSPYSYTAGQPGAMPQGPVPPVTTSSWWKRPAVFVTSLLLAFLLGMGSFAVGARVWSLVTPGQGVQTPGRVPSGNNPWYPGNGRQVPDQQQQDGQDQGQSDQGGAQPRSATLPTDAQTKGIVLIEASSQSGVGAGTGMVLTADGKVLTNYHVVAGSEKVSVTLADTGDTYDATVVGFDEARDVALLQLAHASNLPTITPDGDPLAVGDTVSAVGNSQGGGELVRADGQVTATNQDLTVSSESPWGAEEDLKGLIQTDADAVPGDSGGPMFDSQNEVTGMTTAGSMREGDSYAIPIATALQVVQVIEAGKDSGTVRVGPAGYLGIVVADTTRRGGSSRMITQVVDGSPADAAGIEVGSTLKSVDGTTIKSSTNLADVIRVLEPGQRVKVEWTTPDGDSKSAQVTLGASPIN